MCRLFLFFFFKDTVLKGDSVIITEMISLAHSTITPKNPFFSLHITSRCLDKNPRPKRSEEHGPLASNSHEIVAERDKTWLDLSGLLLTGTFSSTTCISPTPPTVSPLIPPPWEKLNVHFLRSHLWPLVPQLNAVCSRYLHLEHTKTCAHRQTHTSASHTYTYTCTLQIPVLPFPRSLHHSAVSTWTCGSRGLCSNPPRAIFQKKKNQKNAAAWKSSRHVPAWNQTRRSFVNEVRFGSGSSSSAMC